MSLESGMSPKQSAPSSGPAVSRSSHIWSSLGLISLGIFATSIAGLAVHNLGNRYFWTDESSSFFTALGWPAPGQEPGGISEIQQTLITFLDPGLFHLMIRGWSETFGTSIQSLRSLPFIFFVFYVITLLLWYRRFQLPLLVAVAGVSVMMLDNITPYYSVEVRAYSASLAAAVALPLAAVWFMGRPQWNRLVAFLGASAFLGAMQYTAASVNIATGVLVLAGFVQKKAPAERWRLAIGALFTLAWLPFIYLITRGWPSRGAEVDLDHVRNLVLAYMDTTTLLQTLSTNFVSFTALPRTLFLIAVPVIFLITKARSSNHTDNAAPKNPPTPLVQLWIYVAALTGSAALLSIGGFLPWVLGTRWSITEIAGIALSVLGFIVLLRDYSPPALWDLRIARIAVTVTCIAVVLLGSARIWTYERPGDSQALDDLVPVLVSGDPQAPIVIDYWVFPDTRYWVEYSGEFEASRQAWVDRGVVSTDGFVEAGPAAIDEFLHSSSDRMLLKDTEALEALSEALPPSVRVIYPREGALASPGLVSPPVVLVKDDS